MSGAAADAPVGMRRDLRMLGAALAFEFRKLTAWRAGFVLRELMRGMWRPLVMIFVYRAIADASGKVGDWSYVELVRYLIVAATFEKLLFHQRGLDIADQIYRGYITKYFVMPTRFFLLPFARFVQHLGVQSTVCALLWTVGALAFPNDWPRPASFVAFLEAATLVVLGSYCYFLACFLVETLAFWLEVVWTLHAMSTFVFSFVAGVLVPVSLMPAAVRAAFPWCFPYWGVFAPVELYLGRQDHADFRQGLLVLVASIVGLELLRQSLWRRGLAKYTGAGM